MGKALRMTNATEKGPVCAGGEITESERIPPDAFVFYFSDLVVDLCESEVTLALATKARRCVLEHGLERLHKVSEDGALALAFLADAVIESLEKGGDTEGASALVDRVEASFVDAPREGVSHLKGLITVLENRAYRLVRDQDDFEGAESLFQRMLDYGEAIVARSGLEDDRKELVGLYELHCDLAAANGVYWECSSLCRGRISERASAMKCPGLKREREQERLGRSRCSGRNALFESPFGRSADEQKLDAPAITILEGGLKGKERRWPNTNAPMDTKRYRTKKVKASAVPSVVPRPSAFRRIWNDER